MSEARKFAVFDIDGTLIRWQLYHAIVNQLAKQGAIPPVANEKIHAARMTWKNRSGDKSFGEYEMTLVKSYWSSLKSITPAEHDKAIATVFEEYKDQVYTYTRDLIRELKTKDYLLFAISGSHQEIIDKLAYHYGFDAAIGQVHEVKNGHYSGEHTTPMLNKGRELDKLIKKFNVTKKGSLAIGDSVSDIELLEMAENPIAFNPNKDLYETARAKGWRVVIERKNVIYRLEVKNGQYVLA